MEVAPISYAAKLAERLGLNEHQSELLVEELRLRVTPAFLAEVASNATAAELERVLRLADAIEQRARREDPGLVDERAGLLRRAGVDLEAAIATPEDRTRVLYAVVDYALAGEARWTSRIKLLENRIGFAAEALRGRGQ